MALRWHSREIAFSPPSYYSGRRSHASNTLGQVRLRKTQQRALISTTANGRGHSSRGSPAFCFRTGHGAEAIALSRRCLQTAASLAPAGFPFSRQADHYRSVGPHDTILLPAPGVPQWDPSTLVDNICQDALYLKTRLRKGARRLGVFKNISRTEASDPATTPAARISRASSQNPAPVVETSLITLPEASAALIPHALFRARLRIPSLSDKTLRRILRAQLLRCLCPKDVLRIAAVAFQRDRLVQNLAILKEPLMRAMYRCRATSSDPAILSVLMAIISRFHMVKGLQISPDLVFLAVKFAARSRNVEKMRRCLRWAREWGLGMNNHVFRAIIAKCSIGRRGLGEIRNGRWRRKDLLQVLKGFDEDKMAGNSVPCSGQTVGYHLETWLDRTDWCFMHGWVSALARCRDSEGVYKEWELWKANEQPKRRLRDPNCPVDVLEMRARQEDAWFLDEMTLSGDGALSWKLFTQANLDFARLHSDTKDRMLAQVEHCPPELWRSSAAMREEMVRKWDRDLARIEETLGVKWVRPGKSGAEEHGPASGSHIRVETMESVLEKLSSPDFSAAAEDFGYPWEDDEGRVAHSSMGFGDDLHEP